MKAFTAPLKEYAGIGNVRDAVKKENFPVRITGCTDSLKSNLIAALSSETKTRLILAPDETKAKELYNDLLLYDPGVLLYPAKDIMFYSADIRGNAIVRERLRCIDKLIHDEPVTIVMSFTACMDKISSKQDVLQGMIHIDDSVTIDTEELAGRLISMGYERTAEASEPGEFAIRGGIIDVFPLACVAPYRIELWGDSIDSMRIYDAASQRSIEEVSSFDILPASEFVISEERTAAAVGRITEDMRRVCAELRSEFKTQEAYKLESTVTEFLDNLKYLRSKVSIDSYVDYFFDNSVSILDYFTGSDSLIFLDEPARTLENAEAADEEFIQGMQGRLERGGILPRQSEGIFHPASLMGLLSKSRVIEISTLDYRFPQLEARCKEAVEGRSINSYNGDFELLVNDLLTWKKNKYRIILLTASQSRAQRLAAELRDRELNAFCTTDSDREVSAGEIMVVSGGVTRGFEYPLIRFAIISESDIFGKKKKPVRKKLYEGTRIPDFSSLENGDYVVHESYGVGVYRGIEKIEVDGVGKDYIKIEYAGGGTLYVSATQMDSVQKYSGPEGHAPKLNKLDSNEWKNTKSRVRGAVREVAKDLINLYALRKAKKGYAFSPDTVWQREFEEQFPYEETDDQERAIADTKRDMESTQIMDRLVCGDVGFGKTEIAIRAAFKAVQDGKQVAVLVPTTILAQQHFNTFTQRMQDCGVTVEMLSRFKTPTQQKKILELLKAGRVDIVIGTHRLLSKDVVFKDLGLLVVDEEQRFGVTHKEKIKQLKGDVDVITLTATPIPRTLHMSLIGIRDMSLLEEAPVDRLPIQTFVLEHDDEIIREAVNRELARGGQVYYVYNRVRGIEDVTASISRLVPDANVVYAHGQMNEHELERIMFAFVNGEIDVLVSTTIIETGLDISNVNTMIIDDADRLGLSQLYQLRGRVGRSARTAYAFIMYRRNKELTEVAQKRLEAIRDFTELGSGFRIAMRDLEIRGAGNLLGSEQSGHMEAVGYDLYCKLLNEAVKSLQDGGELSDDTFDTMVDLDTNAYIPSSYIKNEIQKLEAYKRIAAISSQEEYIDMQEELTDRYGDIPATVNNLLDIARIKSMAREVYITSISQKKRMIRIDFYAKAKLKVECFPELLEKFKDFITFRPGKVPFLEADLSVRGNPSRIKSFAQIVGELKELLTAMKEIML